ncbi:hypothetical protein, partial [Pseudomonas sp. MWU13-2105]|uniref:hypothetical protein n=1 Tax=Pseudomonas sp. MWU13-2105 TaxID=2935074 RepID=UPI00200E7C75
AHGNAPEVQGAEGGFEFCLGCHKSSLVIFIVGLLDLRVSIFGTACTQSPCQSGQALFSGCQ